MKTNLKRWKMLFAALVLAGALGCQFLGTKSENPAPAVTRTAPVILPTATAEAAAIRVPTAVVETATESPTATAAAIPTVEAAPDEIDALLGLRSVRIKLSVDREGEGNRDLAAEIDSGGNMRIANSSYNVESNVPKELYADIGWIQQDVLVVGGEAYREDGEGGQWAPAPGLADYLERSLRGSEGPGLWLRLIAGGTREARGQEAVGPYTANHFIVSGNIDGSTASGEIWIDAASGALVGANLEVDGVLFTHTDGGVHYPVKILLEVTPADVEPVNVP